MYYGQTPRASRILGGGCPGDLEARLELRLCTETITFCTTDKLGSWGQGAKKPKVDRRPFLIYDYGINNHVFSHRAACKPVGASSGWLRYEDTRIPAERRVWKTGNRDKKPEQEPFSLEKLQRRLKAQVHAGSMPKQTRRRLALANATSRIAMNLSRSET